MEQLTNTQEFIQQLNLDALQVQNLKFQYKEETPISIKEVKNILITGTTGFLGVFLLSEILHKLDNLENIYCLVRAKDISHAQQRIIDNLIFYQLYNNLNQKQLNKIQPVLGDISKQNLGIQQNIYENLSQNIQFVYHCAAAVDFVSSYEQIKPATVLGTKNILEFCSQKEAKYLFFVSTNGILRKDKATKFYENKDIDQYLPYLVNDGYGQTKWVAEKMMWICEKNGLKLSAFRYGNIGHVQKTGAKNPIDFQSQLLETCQKIDSCPDNDDWLLEATPVDFIANIMVELAFNPQNFGKVYHVIEDEAIESLKVFKALQDKSLIKNIESYDIWLKKLQEFCEQNPNEKSCIDIRDSINDLIKYLTDPNSYDRQQIKNDLKELNIDYKPVDALYYLIILQQQKQ